ncbi:MAG: GTPase Era [Myxococcales bacterium]|nr:MAG: GTPase Era [Myxococcales bacterium]
MTDRSESRAGAVALAGAPNVGKSTLLNQILGRRVSIATPKPQTTRAQLLGIHTDGAIQVLFVDTPGIHVTQGMIHERMVRHARAGVRGADVVCWLVAADRGLRHVDRREIPRLAEREPIVVVNKIDRVSREALLPIMAGIAELAPEATVVPLSALNGDNVAELMALIKTRMPEGPWLFPAESITDRPLRFLAAELVREQAFRQLDQEIPYHMAVLTEVFEERGDTTYIEALVYTDSDSAKRIIVGKQGARIKAIGQAARKQIERPVDGKVYLDLHVRVKKDWQQDPRFLEELGM